MTQPPLLELLVSPAWLWLAPLALMLAWALRAGSPSRQDLAGCEIFGEPALAELPALSGFSPALPPSCPCLARFYTPEGLPLWREGDGWSLCAFILGERGWVADPLGELSGAYALPAQRARSEAAELLDASLRPPKKGPRRL